MIPKIIHQIFLNSSTCSIKNMPKEWLCYHKLFKRLHPTWECILWTDETIFPFIEKEYPQWEELIKNIQIAAMQSDIIRYMLLQHFGGWYFDLDYEPIHALHSFENEKIKIILPLEHSIAYGNNYDQIGNSALASEKNHPFWNILLKEIWQNKKEIENCSFQNKEDVIVYTGPRMINKIFTDLSEQEKSHYEVLRRENFHMPFTHPLTHKEYKSIVKNTHVYALHHCHSIWRLSSARKIKVVMRRKRNARRIPLLHYLFKLEGRLKRCAYKIYKKLFS